MEKPLMQSWGCHSQAVTSPIGRGHYGHHGFLSYKSERLPLVLVIPFVFGSSTRAFARHIPRSGAFNTSKALHSFVFNKDLIRVQFSMNPHRLCFAAAFFHI